MGPAYYAAGRVTLEFVVTGSGFNDIPMSALAIGAIDNSQPLAQRYTQITSNVMRLVERSDNRMVFRSDVEGEFINPHYLGCIVTANRNVVIYKNDTNPLP